MFKYIHVLEDLDCLNLQWRTLKPCHEGVANSSQCGVGGLRRSSLSYLDVLADLEYLRLMC